VKVQLKIFSIEAIRGFAAIYVIIGHIVLLYNPQNFFPQIGFLIKTAFSFGHQAVILFFIVSGFSIHYSTQLKKRNLQKTKKEYFFSRWKRLYPLFFLSLILSMLVLYMIQIPSSNLRNYLSFVFLTDISKGSFSDPLPTNFPIWSLSYEVLYYLVYPFLWVYISKYSIQKIFFYSIVLSIVASLISSFCYPNHLTNVFQYYWTWVAGAWIADMKLKNTKVSAKYFKGSIVFCLALMLTLENVFILRDWFWALFFVLILISYFSKIEGSTQKQTILNFTIGTLGILFAFLVTNIESAVFHPVLLRYLLVGILFFMLFFLVIPFHKFQKVLRVSLYPFVSIGSFSYALYIFNWPIILLFKYYFISWAELSFLNMSALIFVNFAFIFLLSWVLEMKLQQKISAQLSKMYVRFN